MWWPFFQALQIYGVSVVHLTKLFSNKAKTFMLFSHRCFTICKRWVHNPIGLSVQSSKYDTSMLVITDAQLSVTLSPWFFVFCTHFFSYCCMEQQGSSKYKSRDVYFVDEPFSNVEVVSYIFLFSDLLFYFFDNSSCFLFDFLGRPFSSSPRIIFPKRKKRNIITDFVPQQFHLQQNML